MTRASSCPSDFLTALLAEPIVRKEPGATVLCDVRASRAVRDLVERAGRHRRVDRVGHAFFKPRMRDRGTAFGGEVSGHYYFRDFYCADCGAIPALLILELLSVEGRKLSQLLEPLRSRYFIAGEINFEVEDQEGRTEELVARYRTVTSAASTGSPSTMTTGTSTCALPTRSRSCDSTSSHSSPASI
jgi:phosphomannomutase